MFIILIASSILSVALLASIIVLIRKQYKPAEKPAHGHLKPSRRRKSVFPKRNNLIGNGIVSRGILN